jgi:hypothetical protein
MVAIATTQLVLVESDVDAAVRINHNARLFYGRSAQAAPTPGAPWYLWKQTPRQIEPEEDARRNDNTLLNRFRLAPAAVTGVPTYFYIPPPPYPEAEDGVRVNQTLLHRYRQSFQTVGQNYRLWPQPVKGDQSIEPEQRVDQTTLHRYRRAFQTVGQPWMTWPGPSKRVDAEDYGIPKPVDLTAFRNSQPITATAGQPWYLWAPPIQRIDPEDDARRGDTTLLHRYRTGYQTVGQPWALVTWKGAVADQTLEPDAQREDHTLLNRFRVGFQTVGQSWQYWIKPQQRVDEETYTVPAPADLYPYRQITIQAQPGQPWWAWPPAVAGQDVEPNPTVTDHAAALYPFRPHQAVPPVPPVTDVLVSSGYTWEREKHTTDLQIEEEDIMLTLMVLLTSGYFDADTGT